MATDFGSDFAGIGEGDFDLSRDVEGVDLLNQALAIRLSNDRGSFLDAADECMNLSALINEGMSRSDVAKIGALARAQVMRDNRVDTCNVNSEFSIVNGQASVTLEISGQSELGPFALTLSVDKLTVALLNGD